MVNQRNFFFPSQQSNQAVELAKDDPLAAREHIQLATFNSKTFVPVVQFFDKLVKTECELIASGKSVDFYDPIPPIPITRGFKCCYLMILWN